MSQTVQRYRRQKKRRDWRNPFEWFTWYFAATSLTALISVARLAEDNTGRLAEDDTIRITE